ncbi:TetR family transcriptional regulator [Luteimicrobium subarcticum]|uniref:TetR family transcriptional regulator n=1 Tax=Luteimicrobium subarcticum TaxID=620910 RepID=A0A2M8WQU8_9MICO|nr:TetR family transcriptional regulator [Luteimicrobium subarcticum]PJI93311.1 TetR family transcriptional regulator [Luteimicrobium subarcticum]
MARWQPDTPDRLRVAASELFAEQGFDETSVAQIADRAGLTERTFFRYFADKREVLFDGQEQLRSAFRTAVEAAPVGEPLLDLAERVVGGLSVFFSEERRAWSRRRAAIITGHPGLQERELLKMTTITSDLADVFRARGLAAGASTVAAGTVVAIFHTAFAQWVASEETRDFAALAAAAVADLRGALSGA